MIGKNYQLKVSDHAMFCSQYEGDYYVSDTKAKLPIRWMAWESLLLVSHRINSDRIVIHDYNVTGDDCYLNTWKKDVKIEPSEARWLS